MSITVLQGGLQSTVQDLGRNGYAHYGISASGAADAVSLRIGNLLVGNPEDYSGLEMTLTGGEYQFNKDAFIALSGSEFHANLDGETFPFHFFKMQKSWFGFVILTFLRLPGGRFLDKIHVFALKYT